MNILTCILLLFTIINTKLYCWIAILYYMLLYLNQCGHCVFVQLSPRGLIATQKCIHIIFTIWFKVNNGCLVSDWNTAGVRRKMANPHQSWICLTWRYWPWMQELLHVVNKWLTGIANLIIVRHMAEMYGSEKLIQVSFDQIEHVSTLNVGRLCLLFQGMKRYMQMFL